MNFLVRATLLASGLCFLFQTGPGVAKEQDRPPIPVTVHDKSDTVYAKASSEEAYDKGHDALVAGKPEVAIELFESSCTWGNPKSCFNVGILNEEKLRQVSKGNPQSAAPDMAKVAQIIRAFSDACDTGFYRGCAMLIQYYRLPSYGMQDLAKAIQMARMACDARETYACEDFAEMQYRGEGMPVDLPRAAEMFKNACDAGGRALSCFNYALMSEKGQGLAKNTVVARHYYRNGCKRGSDFACINLATDYFQNTASTTDREIAKGLLEKSCNGGIMIACHNLAVLIVGNDPQRADEVRAEPLYRKACNGGDGDACRGLGNLARVGVKEAGTKRESVQLFVQGCRLGSGKSCFNAGLMYFIGLNIPKNERSALAWFGNGCYLGSASSCAGAALAAVGLKPGDPNGGKEMGKKWIDHARHFYPEDGLVKALDGWLADGAKASEAPKLLEQGDVN